MKDDNNIQEVINTKVSPSALEQLKRICAKRGITLYEMLQMVCDTFIRYMSEETNLSDEIKEAIQLFQGMKGWKNAYNLCDKNAEHICFKAIYFLHDPKKDGMRAVMVKSPEMYPLCTEWMQTANEQDIFEEMMCNLFPSLYKRLRTIGVAEECEKALETIDILCRQHEHDDDGRAMREEFEDCDRSDFGKKPTDHRYKRKHHKSVDTFLKPERIKFSADDVPGEEGHNEMEDFKPFGCEW